MVVLVSFDSQFLSNNGAFVPAMRFHSLLALLCRRSSVREFQLPREGLLRLWFFHFRKRISLLDFFLFAGNNSFKDDFQFCQPHRLDQKEIDSASMSFLLRLRTMIVTGESPMSRSWARI
jgi:hypothetical protein